MKKCKLAGYRKLLRWKRRQKEAYAMRDQGMTDNIIAKTLNVSIYEVRGYWMYPLNQQ